MARRPNFGFEKRQRELERQKKKDAKNERKQAQKEDTLGDDPSIADEIGEVQGVSQSCPYCAESVELVIDSGGGEIQDYVEDCPVCCRPWEVTVIQQPDGSWDASLRTSDE